MYPGIRSHMEIIGSDGGHVGRVDHVVGDDIELACFDLDGGVRRHLIPISWVYDITGDKVRLNLSEDAARSAWREKR